MVWPAVIAAAASLAGAGIGAAGSAKAAKAQKAEAQRNREFQQSMYMHRYQWQMEDMRRAGLNPILSYKMGAPGGASPSSVAPINVGAPIQEGIGRAVSSALAARRQGQELKVMKQQEEKLQEEKFATATLGAKYRAEYERLKQDYRLRKADEAEAKAREELYKKHPELRKLEIINRSLGGGAAGVLGGILGGAAIGGTAKSRARRRGKKEHPTITVDRDGTVRDRGRKIGKFRKRGMK